MSGKPIVHRILCNRKKPNKYSFGSIKIRLALMRMTVIIFKCVTPLNLIVTEKGNDVVKSVQIFIGDFKNGSV